MPIGNLESFNTGSGGSGAVDSVNSQTGVVTLDEDDIPEGTTNKKFTATEKTKLGTIEDNATADQTKEDIDALNIDADTVDGMEAAAFALASALASYVAKTGNESVGGVKTFTSFPVTPSSAPSSDYEVANKKYVDDSISVGGAACSCGSYVGDGTQQTVAHGLGVKPKFVFLCDRGGSSGRFMANDTYFNGSYTHDTSMTTTTYFKQILYNNGTTYDWVAIG